jgi:hypothetical protein
MEHDEACWREWAYLTMGFMCSALLVLWDVDQDWGSI